MNRHFESDPFPGKPRILFIGSSESSHTHSWVELLEGAQFNVRLFAMPSGTPPSGWQVRTYVTTCYCPALDARTRARLFSANRFLTLAKRGMARLLHAETTEWLAERWLARIVARWRPDIIHTFGLDSAGEFYFRVRRKYGLERVGKWVLQTRGGSDLALTHLNPVRNREIAEMLQVCDQLLSDNQQNFRIAREMGVREEQLSRIGTVPGTGGVEVDALSKKWQGAPSQRRMILWPKTYESPWAKVLPVFEALKLCWEQIQPCEIQMLSMNDEARMWYWALPPHIREGCRRAERLPRAEVLKMMLQARVVLAPSLVDGVPNSMYEAMAAGAFPIVSPLETILPLVENERNVLFARNLYPQEIADALTRAMNDDKLVDEAAERNLALVSRSADHNKIRPRVIDFYETLAGS